MKPLRALLVGMVFGSLPAGGANDVATQPPPVYDPNPQHLWNRLENALFVRTPPVGRERYGADELDILYWTSTRHLLTSPSREAALAILDEFIRTHGERLIRDPLERALLQRDLWELFDWSASYAHSQLEPESLHAREELQRRLVTLMRRLALTDEEIARLPDNYALADSAIEAPGFPHDLFTPNGSWVQVGHLYGPTASEHTQDFGGRSVFEVFAKFPDGREQALRYLDTLRQFAPALVYPAHATDGTQQTLLTNPATPQFPAHTVWALVRRLCLIDAQGRIRPTRLIESIETRTYASVPEGDALDDPADQVMAEFQLNRRALPSLRVVSADEKDFQFVHFRSQGVDLFELWAAAQWERAGNDAREQTLRTCRECHQAPGIFSVNSYALFHTAAHPLVSSTPEREADATVTWKSGQFDWGLLRGIWQSQTVSRR